MAIKTYFFIFICFLGYATAHAQTHTGVVSVGYGFPSILRFVINSETRLDIVPFGAQGFGPLHAKAEYIFKRRIGIGGSIFYNNIHFKISDKTVDTFIYRVNDLSINARLNIYAINNAKHQLYVGAGIGRLNFKNILERLTRPEDTFLKYTPTLELSNKKSLEATIGYRRFIKYNIGLYTEIGIGRAIVQFMKNGAIDSYAQAGISYRLAPKKKKQLKTTVAPL